MASDFIINKWKKTFFMFDINKDDVINMDDASIFGKKFSTITNMNETAAEELRSDISAFYQGFFLRGGPKTTEEQFINSMTEEFTKSHEEFFQNTRKHFAILVSTADSNNDGLVSGEELRNLQKACGIMTFHNKHYEAYPRVKLPHKSIPNNNGIGVPTNEGSINGANGDVSGKPVALKSGTKNGEKCGTVQNGNNEIRGNRGTSQHGNDEIDIKRGIMIQAGNSNIGIKRTTIQAGNNDIATKHATIQAGNNDIATKHATIQAGNNDIATKHTTIQAGNNAIATKHATIQAGNNDIATKHATIQAGNNDIATKHATIQAGNSNICIKRATIQAGNNDIATKHGTSKLGEINNKIEASKAVNKSERHAASKHANTDKNHRINTSGGAALKGNASELDKVDIKTLPSQNDNIDVNREASETRESGVIPKISKNGIIDNQEISKNRNANDNQDVSKIRNSNNKRKSSKNRNALDKHCEHTRVKLDGNHGLSPKSSIDVSHVTSHMRAEDTDGIKSELFLESWVAFCCNNDESDIHALEKARMFGFRMLQSIDVDTESFKE